MTPYVHSISKQGKETMDLATYHFQNNRCIYLTGEIDDNCAQSINMQLDYLGQIGNEKIIMYINSPGGSVTAALSIVDTMKRLKQEIITVCTGIAASAAAVITTCGTRRYITPFAEMMIHQPLGRAAGQAVDIELTAVHIAKVKQRLHVLLAEHTKQSIEIIASDCDRDFYLDAHEAVHYGLVDEILYEPLTATSSTA